MTVRVLLRFGLRRRRLRILFFFCFSDIRFCGFPRIHQLGTSRPRDAGRSAAAEKKAACGGVAHLASGAAKSNANAGVFPAFPQILKSQLVLHSRHTVLGRVAFLRGRA